jgi:hypothetical protein
LDYLYLMISLILLLNNIHHLVERYSFLFLLSTLLSLESLVSIHIKPLLEESLTHMHLLHQNLRVVFRAQLVFFPQVSPCLFLSLLLSPRIL